MSDGLLNEAVIVTNALGLHARPSIKLTKIAKKYACKIELAQSESGPWIDAKSPVQVMRFRVAQGQLIHFRAAGEAASLALAELVDLVRRNFDEDDSDGLAQGAAHA